MHISTIIITREYDMNVDVSKKAATSRDHQKRHAQESDYDSIDCQPAMLAVMFAHRGSTSMQKNNNRHGVTTPWQAE